MTLVSPAENSSVVGRKPTIRGAFGVDVVPSSVTIVVDGTDYSAMAVKTQRGFELTPPLPLPPGPHSVTVAAQDAQGNPYSRTASFSSRHTVAFDEVGSASTLTATYDYTLKEPSHLDNTIADWKVEANLSTSNVLRKGPWKASFDAVGRYKDQDLTVAFPERKGGDIVSYTLRTGYEKGTVKGEAAVGDVVVDQTPYTLAMLGRKGAKFTGDLGFLAVDAFTVQGQSVYGTRGGLSLDGGTDSHIRGGSGTIRLFSNRLALKTVYVEGGERGPSFNIGTAGGGKKGEVLGFRMMSDFFAGKLKTDFELDFSEFTPDTAASGAVPLKDKAFRIAGDGASGIFTYGARYEQVGRDYEVVGNQGLAKNRSGAAVQGTANFGTQTVGVIASRYRDNVRNDPLLPTNVSWEATLQYALNRWPTLPMSFAYKWGLQTSDDVAGVAQKTLDAVTNDASGQVTWIKGIVSTSFSGGYSKRDDRTALGADSSTWNLRLAPGFNGPTLSVTPSAAYAETEAGSVRTEIATLGLDGRAQFFNAKVTAELGGTWVSTLASDRSQDNRNLTGNFRLAYNPGTFLSGHFRPSIAFRGTYVRLEDQVNPALDRDDWTLFLTLSAEIPVIL